MKKIAVFAILCCMISCNSNDDDQQACTEEFVYGLSITIKDANTNMVITEDLTVTATDGNYQEQLMRIENSDEFIGAGEREGAYTIEVSSPNHQAFVSDIINVELTSDGCHVMTEIREFQILPN